MLLYTVLVLCVAGFAALVLRYDMYDREPKWLLGLATGLGCVAMALSGVAERLSLRGGHVTSEAGIAALAAFEEEGLKLLVVAAIALAFPRVFNDPMDGIVYGSLSGAGMALEESLSALRSAHAIGPLPPPVELVRICGHVIMGGIAGFPLGLARLRHPAWPAALVLCGGAAFGLHFGWDWIALSAPGPGPLPPRMAALAVALMLAGLGAYGRLVSVASRWSRELFAPGAPEGPWGWPFRRE